MPVETIEDPSLSIKPGNKLVEFVLKRLKNVDKAPIGIRTLKSATKKQRLNILLKLDDMKWLNGYLEELRKSLDHSDKVYLHEFLEESEIILPKPKETPRNPELDARVKKLQAQQNARDYQAMTKSVDCVRKHLPEDTIAFQIKQMNKHLIAVAQFIFSVAAGFAFGFIGTELLVGNLDVGFRLLLGVMCALTIALAEMYFLAVKLNEEPYDVGPSAPATSKSTPMTQDLSSTKLHQE